MASRRNNACEALQNAASLVTFGCDEPGDVRLSAGLAELGKQVAHAVRGLFHQRILIFVFAEPGRPQYRPDALPRVPCLSLPMALLLAVRILAIPD